MSTLRVRSLLLPSLLAALLAATALLAVGPTSASTARADAGARTGTADVGGTIKVSLAKPMPREFVLVTGSTQISVKRPVYLQIRSKGKAWESIQRIVSGQRGGFTFSFRAPKKQGTYQVRAHAPAGRYGGEEFRDLDTAPQPVNVVADRLILQRNPDALVDGSFEFFASFSQARRGRPVWLQVPRPDGAAGSPWKTIAKAKQNAKGVVRFSEDAGSVEEARTYRVVAPQYNRAPATASKALRSNVTHWVDIANGNGGFPNPTCGLTATNHLYCSTKQYKRDASAPVFGDVRYDIADYTDIESPGLNTTCAVTVDTDAYCWGSDDNGKLGNGGGVEDTLGPQQVIGGDWKTISPGYEESCGIKTDTTLWCWGDSREPGEPEATIDTPQQVGTDTGYTDVDTGVALACWLRNGALGCNGVGADEVDTLVDANYGDWTDIAVGYDGVCGLRDEGALYCDRYSDHTPGGVRLGGSDRFTALDMGGSDVCAVRDDGTLWCSSDDVSGGSPFQQIGTETDWADVDSDAGDGCALTTAGEVRCWSLLVNRNFDMRTLGIGV